MRSRGVFVTTLALGAACLAASVPAEAGAAAAGDATRGRLVYRVCEGCHSVDEDDIGPRHRGVVGRRAGSISGFAYSPALRASGITWDAATLDRWLTDPQRLVPGTRMFFNLQDPRDRADVIAYLEQLH